MKQKKIQTIGLSTIETTVSNSDIETARTALSFALGASMTITGRVEKRVKRNELCKLLINPDNATMQVIADCKVDEQIVISRKIRKGSTVTLHGRLLSFGANAVCLSDARLQ
jgi:aspartyl/asparaginyl-tRNA synthetase